MSDRVVSERELEDILGYEADFTGAFYKPTTTFLMARELLALRASREAVISALRNQGLLQNTATGVIWHVHDCPASFDFSECHYRCRVAREALAGTEPYHAGWKDGYEAAQRERGPIEAVGKPLPPAVPPHFMERRNE